MKTYCYLILSVLGILFPVSTLFAENLSTPPIGVTSEVNNYIIINQLNGHYQVILKEGQMLVVSFKDQSPVQTGTLGIINDSTISINEQPILLEQIESVRPLNRVRKNISIALILGGIPLTAFGHGLTKKHSKNILEDVVVNTFFGMAVQAVGIASTATGALLLIPKKQYSSRTHQFSIIQISS